jgi:polyvinyl alcohol dehydrogenase (cytochrome)
VTAVDTRTGKTLWKTYTIPEKAQPTRTSRAGTQLWGPSGAGIWSTPTLDQKRRCLYAATGDSYSDPVASNSDAVVAFDLDSGAIRWSNQTISNDASNDGCTAVDRSNCPTENGPDYDFGSSPVMAVLPDGREMLLVGQKSGIVYAMDPNNKGHIVWQSRVGKGGRLGGVEWGMAAGEGALYAAISDASFKRANNPSDAPSRRMGTGMELDPHRGGGLTALRLSDGKPLWRATPAGQGPWWHFGLFALPDPCAGRQPCSPAQTAAVTHIPGAVLSGALDGHMRAYSSFDGHILWDYDTVREYTTVNGGKAHGGSLDGPGATVVDGMVYLNSGYGWWYGTPGNVLLAFSIAAIDKKLR